MWASWLPCVATAAPKQSISSPRLTHSGAARSAPPRLTHSAHVSPSPRSQTRLLPGDGLTAGLSAQQSIVPPWRRHSGSEELLRRPPRLSHGPQVASPASAGIQAATPITAAPNRGAIRFDTVLDKRESMAPLPAPLPARCDPFGCDPLEGVGRRLRRPQPDRVGPF